MARKNSKARKPARRSRSNIGSAQQSAFQRYEERNKSREQKIANPPKRPATGMLGATQLNPSQPHVQMQRGVNQDEVKRRDTVGKSMLDAANRVTENARKLPGSASVVDKNITNPQLYARSAQQEFDSGAVAYNRNGDPVTLAQVQQQAAALRTAGTGVYMGKSRGYTRQPNFEFEGGGNRVRPEQIAYDNFVNINNLMAWLTDPDQVAMIQKRAKAFGLNADSYDDISKLWASVLATAAKTYQTTGRKVTPWDIMAVRGRFVDPTTGRPKRRTGKNITIEDIDPATARLKIEEVVKKMTGQRPTEDEIDAFVAKAHQIAQSTPLVETFSQDVGFDDQPVQNTLSVTSRTGGQEVAMDRAEAALLDELRKSPEYSNYQAAGFYGPLLAEAIRSPV